MKTVPDTYYDIGSIMSNYDHEIEDGAEERLKKEKVFGGYAGWNFWGEVWFEAGKFYCVVEVYKRQVATKTGNSLNEIMEKVGDEFGYA